MKDFRNLVRVRDYDSPSKMDEMKKWEIMNSSPTVEYQADGDGVDGKKPFYTPKVRVTFYLYRDARQPFLETIAPIIFALFANALNVVFSEQFEEFLANVVAMKGNSLLCDRKSQVQLRAAISPTISPK